MISRLKVKKPGFTCSARKSEADLVIDLESSVDFNCYYSWDNVSEDTVEINGTVTSNVINFDNKVLTDYTKSITNRALRIDDFSDIFNSNQRLNSSLLLCLIHPLVSITRSLYALVTDQEFQNDTQMAILAL